MQQSANGLFRRLVVGVTKHDRRTATTGENGSFPFASIRLQFEQSSRDEWNHQVDAVVGAREAVVGDYCDDRTRPGRKRSVFDQLYLLVQLDESLASLRTE